MDGKIKLATDVARASRTSTRPNFSVNQRKQSDVTAADLERSLADDAVTLRESAPAARNVRGGVNREVARADVSRGEALRRLGEIAASRTRAAQTVAPDSSQNASAVTKNSGEPVFKGVFQDGVAYFNDVELQLKDNGDVEASLSRPDGVELKGKGAIADDGTLRLTFDDGNSYEAKLSIDGARAQLSEVRNTEFKAPAPAVEPTSPKASAITDAPSFTGVYKDGLIGFDGVLLEVAHNGDVDAKIFQPDGLEVNGKGTLDDENNLKLTFEDGNSYEAKLTVDGNIARLSQLRFLGEAK